MKLFIEQKAALAALKAVSRFTNPRCPLPILSHGLLRAEANGAVTLTASDLDAWLTLPLEAAAMAPGEYCVPLGLLGNLLRFLSGPLIITGEENSVTLAAGEDSFTFCALPTSDYPSPPLFEAESSLQLDPGLLRQMLRAVMPAAAKAQDECRAVMTGVNLISRPGSLGMVTTDGRRLATVFASAEEGLAEASVVLHASKLHAFSTVQRPDRLAVNLGKTHAAFEGQGGFRMVVRLLEGRFPDFSKVVPAEELFTTRVVLKKAELMRAIRRALVFAQDKRSPDLIRWTINEDGLAWVSDTPGLGKARGVVPATVEGPAGKVIGFNGGYLLQGLQAIKEDTIEWCFQEDGDTRSSVIRPASCSEFLSQSYVVMPVKLRDVDFDEFMGYQQKRGAA